MAWEGIVQRRQRPPGSSPAGAVGGRRGEGHRGGDDKREPGIAERRVGHAGGIVAQMALAARRGAGCGCGRGRSTQVRVNGGSRVGAVQSVWVRSNMPQPHVAAASTLPRWLWRRCAYRAAVLRVLTVAISLKWSSMGRSADREEGKAGTSWRAGGGRTRITKPPGQPAQACSVSNNTASSPYSQLKRTGSLLVLALRTAQEQSGC